MRQREMQHLLTPPAAGAAEDEGWLTSYLDVLTLLLTLFVLLLSLIPQGESDSVQADAGSVQSSAAPARAGLEPLNDGLDPRLAGLDIPGVRVMKGQQGITLRIDDDLLFASGDATLTAGGRDVIAGLVADLEAFDGEISVEGHTDSVPIATRRFPSNWDLSAARAIAVVRYLGAQDIDTSRLRAVGYGATRPTADNATAAGRAANRRVDILLHRQSGAPAGGERAAATR